MALVTMKSILTDVRLKGYAAGAFEFWSFDSAQAIVDAAQEKNRPVILQAGYDERIVARSFARLGMIGRSVAESVSVPVALHLDHGRSYDEVREALDAGFTSVMIDASGQEFDRNVEVSARVVEMASEFGATVEAELGRLAGSESQMDVKEEEAQQTDPDEARFFVGQTGVDALAVAIGTAHGFYKFEPRINIERLKAIASAVDVPLVLHGGSGTPEDKIIEAIRCGIAKINICTEFVAAMGKQYVKTQNTPGYRYGASSLYMPSYEAGKRLAGEKIKLFSLIP